MKPDGRQAGALSGRNTPTSHARGRKGLLGAAPEHEGAAIPPAAQLVRGEPWHKDIEDGDRATGCSAFRRLLALVLVPAALNPDRSPREVYVGPSQRE